MGDDTVSHVMHWSMPADAALGTVILQCVENYITSVWGVVSWLITAQHGSPEDRPLASGRKPSHWSGGRKEQIALVVVQHGASNARIIPISRRRLSFHYKIAGTVQPNDHGEYNYYVEYLTAARPHSAEEVREVLSTTEPPLS